MKLSNSLSGNSQSLSDLLERPFGVIYQPESHFEDCLISRVERLKFDLDPRQKTFVVDMRLDEVGVGVELHVPTGEEQIFKLQWILVGASHKA